MGSPGLAADVREEQRGEGVVSAGLRTTVLPAASAGAIFHASISSGKFHGMTCPATPSGFGFGPKPACSSLSAPARVVEEVRGDQREIGVARLLDRLAVVQRLQDGELAGALLDDAGDAEEVLGALGAGQRGPLLEGLAGGLDRRVDVLGGRLRDLGEDLLGRRGDGLEDLAVRGLAELAVDEQPVGRRDVDDRARLGGRGVFEGHGQSTVT
ncbi:hypothetical protein GCM10020221_08870 [Streptomyces thioluteus]|uniref:Uncharacterized protein n=1 Tax=Streptomyces thioluteus TaxID=66431 RepID=A0ABN3WHV3_STRTU